METFYWHHHVSLDDAKWTFEIAIFVSTVMLGAIKIGFKTSIWCCILTHIFFWLNTENNADPYISKLSSLSSTKEHDDDPEGKLLSWFGPILFLMHQRNAMDDRWVIAMNRICKNKKSCLYVHKKTSKKLSRPSNPSLGKWRSLSFTFVFYPLSCSSWRYPNTAVAVKGYCKCRFFNVHQSLWSPKVITILIIMKIISFALKQSGWLESKPKIENYN